MSARTLTTGLFCLGNVSATSSALRCLSQQDITAGLRRHQLGDWGDLTAADTAANNIALQEGGRILSSYCTSNGVRFWIITEADRSFTTVLLVDDY
jgi:hypothetical protein